MRHRKRNRKLGRSTAHRRALISSLVCNFIEEQRIRTTVTKAKEARSLAEKMVTLAKKGTLASRRRAIAMLRREPQVTKLFDKIAPQYRDRAGGYTRIVRTGRRGSDGSEMALLEWVNLGPIDRTRKAKPEEAAKTATAATKA
jgi:large subunit ribosomal protein L17